MPRELYVPRLEYPQYVSSEVGGAIKRGEGLWFWGEQLYSSDFSTFLVDNLQDIPKDVVDRCGEIPARHVDFLITDLHNQRLNKGLQLPGYGASLTEYSPNLLNREIGSKVVVDCTLCGLLDCLCSQYTAWLGLRGYSESLYAHRLVDLSVISRLCASSACRQAGLDNVVVNLNVRLSSNGISELLGFERST